MNELGQKEFEEIESYLQDQMDIQERENFESRLVNDPVLRQKTDEIKSLMSDIETVVLKDKLDSYHSTINTQKSSRAILKNKTIFIMSSAALIALVFTLYFVLLPTKNEKLFQSYYKVDPGLPTLMGDSSEDFSFQEGMVYYKQGEYKKAEAIWIELLGIKPDNDTLNYYLGISNVESKKTELALNYFSKIDESSSFYDKAQWYSGLLFLREKQTQKAVEIFEDIESQESNKIIEDLK